MKITLDFDDLYTGYDNETVAQLVKTAIKEELARQIKSVVKETITDNRQKIEDTVNRLLRHYTPDQILKKLE
jgi:nitrogen regulatory protein PII-like uncharacterized protein